MAPVQQTFSLIPQLPSVLNGAAQSDGSARDSRRPMTTKQAKKAYREKNKAPKISKAEQRRMDLMEQDRIRRELEKERNMARAAKAREKRKEKEDREKAEKKKKGLPLVEVHPSQDTIARFVRPPAPNNDLREKGQQQNTGTAAATVLVPVSISHARHSAEPTEVDDSRPAKRQRIGSSPMAINKRGHETEEQPTVNTLTQFEVTRTAPMDNGTTSSDTKVRRLSMSRSTPPKLPAPSLHDPSREEPAAADNTVQKQMLNESFSADDWIFDDIDIDAIAAQATAQKLFSEKPTSPKELPEIHLSKTPAAPPHSSVTNILDNTEALAITKDNSLRVSPRRPAKVDATRRMSTSNDRGKKDHTAEERADAKGENVRIAAPARPEKPRANCPPVSHNRSTPITNHNHANATATGMNSCSREAPRQQIRPRNIQRTNLPKTMLKEGRIESPSRQVLGEVSSNLDLPKTQSVEQSTKKLPGESQHPLRTPQRTVAKPHTSILGPSSFQSPRERHMGGASGPPKFKTPNQLASAPGSTGPKFLRPQQGYTSGQATRSSGSKRPDPIVADMPPSSTQLFLHGNLDDLFPSPSQEVQEIFEDRLPQRKRPAPRPKMLPMAPPPPPASPGQCDKHFGSPCRSHTFQNKSKIDYRNTAYIPIVSHEASPSRARGPPVEERKETDTMGDLDYISFLSTQDMFLSSQDIRELEDVKISTDMPQDPEKLPETEEDGPLITNSPVLGGVPRNSHVSERESKSQSGTHCRVHPAVTVNDGFTLSRLDSPQPTQLTKSPPKDKPCGEAVPSSSNTQHAVISVSEKVSSMRRDGDAFLKSLPVESELVELIVSQDDGLFDASRPDPCQRQPVLAPHITPVAPPRSPKPFFTSSGTRERVFLALERTKTAAWEDSHAGQKAQEALEELLREGEEKAELRRLEKLLEQDEDVLDIATSQQKKPDVAQSLPHSSGDQRYAEGRSRTPRKKGTSQDNQQRNQPRSSYERMLEMLEKSKSDLSVDSANAESDYGEFAWDDDDLANL
ncbi:hypothetical protein BX600DRAFT_471517 [Xylariales sp. PMI_506]|nr:hypothetical protein BX600DRAFT_471517 [Xylariales sp. PMI_506]